MKQKLSAILTATLCAVILFTACKKSDKTTDDSTTDAQIATHSDDESMVSGETDEVTTDVNAVVESDTSFSGNAAVVSQIVCDASVVVNQVSDPMTMTITYNGEACSAKHARTGVVIVSMTKGTHWKNAGAVITVTYHSLKITRKNDQKAITLNGTHTYTNVSGGLLQHLSSQNSITHTISSSNMSINFDDGTARTWSINKKCIYTFDAGVVLTVSGTHAEGDVANIAEWGMNRFDKAFTTVINTPLVFKQACDFRLTSGVVTHAMAAYTATVTFGLDAAGSVSGCPGNGHYYYHLDWTRKNGNHLSIILPY